MVMGFILLNEAQGNKGLCFRKGEGKKTLEYTVVEKCGSCFSFEGEGSTFPKKKNFFLTAFF